MPTTEEKISELTVATKMGDVRDILALVQEIRQHKVEWFGESPATEEIEKLDEACRQSLNAVVEISESQVHAALSRGDVAAARDNFTYIEQVRAFSPNHTETAARISEKIQEAEQQPKRHLSPVRVCPGCGESNALDAVLCKSCGTRISRGLRIPQGGGQSKPGSGGVVIRPGAVPGRKKSSSNMPALVGIGVAVLLAVVLGGYWLISKSQPIDDAAKSGPAEGSKGVPPALPADGSARIAVKTQLRPQPGASDKGEELAKGTEVRFLPPFPESRKEAWAHIELRADNRSGYVQNRELEYVNAGDSQFDQWHAAMSIEDHKSIRAADLRARLDWAAAVISRNAGDVSDDLLIAAAETNAFLSKGAEQANASSNCVQALKQRDRIRSTASYSTRIDSVNNDCVTLVAGRTPIVEKPGDVVRDPRDERPEAREFRQCEAASKSAKSPIDYQGVIGACNDILKRVFKDRKSPGFGWVQTAGSYVREAVSALEASIESARKQYREAGPKPDALALSDLRFVIATCNQLVETPDSRLEDMTGRIRKIKDESAALRKQALRGCGDRNLSCQ